MRASPVDLDGEPLSLLSSLAALPGAALLHVPDPTTPVTVMGAEPVAELRIAHDGGITAHGLAVTTDDPIAALDRFVSGAPVADALPFPLRGGVLGHLAYELGHWTVPRIPVRVPREPLAVLRRYDPLLVYEHHGRRWSAIGERRPAWLASLRAAAPPSDAPLGGPLTPCWEERRYREAIARIHDHLRAGDIYQANLTLPFSAPFAAPAWALCARLAARHPVPYVAYFDLGDVQIVGNSPELFLRVRDRHVTTRPIKGTRRRGDTAAGDAALAAELRADPKERAEHVMIVDLERNDLGRVCDTGSIQVDELLAVESHPSVHHLVSSIGGRLRDGVDLATLLHATFPGGSITGAPKQRAMQILADLEPWPRGPYCGAFGLFDPHGDLELALAIRTAVVRDGLVRWHAGGGIVIDSDPEREWREAWLKTTALRTALGAP